MLRDRPPATFDTANLVGRCGNVTGLVLAGNSCRKPHVDEQFLKLYSFFNRGEPRHCRQRTFERVYTFVLSTDEPQRFAISIMSLLSKINVSWAG